jgi:hypothetical protein
MHAPQSENIKILAPWALGQEFQHLMINTLTVRIKFLEYNLSRKLILG